MKKNSSFTIAVDIKISHLTSSFKFFSCFKFMMRHNDNAVATCFYIALIITSCLLLTLNLLP